MTSTPTIDETLFEQRCLVGTSTELNGERERYRARLRKYLAANHLAPLIGFTKHPAYLALRNGQRKIDMDGCEVAVSR